MGDKQIYFSLVVGLLTGFLGAAITLISDSGFGLIAVGCILICLALSVKIMSKNIEKSAAEIETRTLENISSSQLEHSSEVRHAA